MADDLFTQADLNRDQQLDLNEFRSFLTQNLGLESTNFAADATGGSGGQYTASSHESSSSTAAYGDASSGAESSRATINVVDAGGGDEGTHTSSGELYHALVPGGDTGSFDTNTLLSFGTGGFEANGSSGVDLTTAARGVSLSSTFDAGDLQQQPQVQLDVSNPQNLYQDPNPQIIRRAAQSGQLTYTQNVRLRFLQPPPVPPPGPLIIKEVRPPQPPAPPPLRIRQQAPPLPPPPPLILRERPPNPPASVASQTVIRGLPAIPVPPRSVIIERLPAAPPKPRDIIIERWIPYEAQPKRRTIVQRAAAAKQYPKPRNIIILYEPVQVRVLRQFQRLGITPENPQVYVQRYGISLLDAPTLVQRARAAGVVEDISPPNNVATTAASATSFRAEFNNASSEVETVGNVGLTSAVGVNLTTAGDVGASATSFEPINYSGSSQQGNASFSGFETAQGAGMGGDFLSTSFELSSVSSEGGNAAFGGPEINSAGVSEYASYSTSASAMNSSSSTDPAIAAFHAADLNKDGSLDPNEFRQFLSSQFQYQQ